MCVLILETPVYPHIYVRIVIIEKNFLINFKYKYKYYLIFKIIININIEFYLIMPIMVYVIIRNILCNIDMI